MFAKTILYTEYTHYSETTAGDILDAGDSLRPGSRQQSMGRTCAQSMPSRNAWSIAPGAEMARVSAL
jgi:hypothetical protein